MNSREINQEEQNKKNKIQDIQVDNSLIKEKIKNELLNSQNVNAKENINDEGINPIHNYPYEFYDEISNKIEEKKENIKANINPKIDTIINITKEHKEKINIVNKKIKEENNELNKTGGNKKNINNKEKKMNTDIKKENNKNIKKENNKNINEEKKVIQKEQNIKEEKKNIKKEENKIIKKEESENNKKEETNKNIVKKEEKTQIKKQISKDNKKDENKDIKREENKSNKNEIKKKNIKEEEIKIIKEQDKKVIQKEVKKEIKKMDNNNIKTVEEKKITNLEETKSDKNNKNKEEKEKKGLNDKIEKTEKIKDSDKKEGKIREIILKNIEKKELYPKEESSIPKLKEIKQTPEKKEISKNQQNKASNQYQKTTFTQNIENNYDIMLKKLKSKDYKDFDKNMMNNLMNLDGKNSDIISNMNSNFNKKDLINDFLNRNDEYLKEKLNNNKTINERLYIAYDNSKKRFFNNKDDEKEYFDEFYNKQINYKNEYQMNLDKLTQKINEEKGKYYIPEPKNKNNLDYFKNQNPVVLTKFMSDYKKNIENKKDNDIAKNSNIHSKTKKIQSTQSNGQKKDINKVSKKENSNNNKIKTKLSKKEIDELTNKLHYEGELLKVKKQAMISEEFANNPNYHNFSKDKLSRSSIIILIKKLIYEYSTAIKKNSYLDCIKNPKLNYDQYIDTLKDLYYLETDALPEDYLEENTMYKELWDKLTKFSKGIENSLESNVLLLYILELNGFFRSEKIIKELEPEIYWIKLENYEDLIANAKYIEENWDDLKLRKIRIIQKLKSLKQYNPIHNEEIYGNTINNTNTIQKTIDDKETNHYITIIKGHTDYELIHGYSSKKKNNESDSILEALNSNNANVQNSLTGSKNMNKKNRDRIPLMNSYNEVILKKNLDIENLKQNEEQKFKEVCTFKPNIISINKKMFNNNIKVDLPKYKKNKSVNLFNSNSISDKLDNKNINHNLTSNDFSKNKKSYELKSPLYKSMNLNLSHNPNEKTLKLRKNKSNLEKMFKTNPLKNDKAFNERVQILKLVKSNEIYDDNYMITPMRFNIDYPSKFEGIGVSINRDSNSIEYAPNIIIYNIKINDKIRTLKYIEGEDLKMSVINFVKKNKLYDEVTNIILNKIKEKELEEKMNK